MCSETVVLTSTLRHIHNCTLSRIIIYALNLSLKLNCVFLDLWILKFMFQLWIFFCFVLFLFLITNKPESIYDGSLCNQLVDCNRLALIRYVDIQLFLFCLFWQFFTFSGLHVMRMPLFLNALYCLNSFRYVSYPFNVLEPKFVFYHLICFSSNVKFIPRFNAFHRKKSLCIDTGHLVTVSCLVLFFVLFVFFFKFKLIVLWRWSARKWWMWFVSML